MIHRVSTILLVAQDFATILAQDFATIHRISLEQTHVFLFYLTSNMWLISKQKPGNMNFGIEELHLTIEHIWALFFGYFREFIPPLAFGRQSSGWLSTELKHRLVRSLMDAMSPFWIDSCLTCVHPQTLVATWWYARILLLRVGYVTYSGCSNSCLSMVDPRLLFPLVQPADHFPVWRCPPISTASNGLIKVTRIYIMFMLFHFI